MAVGVAMAHGPRLLPALLLALAGGAAGERTWISLVPSPALAPASPGSGWKPARRSDTSETFPEEDSDSSVDDASEDEESSEDDGADAPEVDAATVAMAEPGGGQTRSVGRAPLAPPQPPPRQRELSGVFPRPPRSPSRQPPPAQPTADATVLGPDPLWAVPAPDAGLPGRPFRTPRLILQPAPHQPAERLSAATKASAPALHQRRHARARCARAS